MKPVRIARHAAFWAARFFYLIYLGNMRSHLFNESFWNNRMNSLLVSLIELGVEMTLTYLIVYWLIPFRLHQKKYFSFTWITAVLISICFTIIFYQQVWTMGPGAPRNPVLIAWVSILFFTGFTLSPCILIIVIRILKAHYEKLKVYEMLNREKANAESQFLKAQVHPHFLFNTLNNIYSFSLNKSSKAGELLAQLSDLMHYMIYDCEDNLMSLKRELKMLSDYIGLEKVRYGDRIDIQMETEGDCDNRKIVPLLMISLVENSFKHGASQVLGQPWIKIRIVAENNRLDFRISNNKPFTGNTANGKNGIGLRNIRKRLELLYPGCHDLKIDPGPDAFYVHLQIPLEN
ncbi:sensor histidine kinase [Flavitalea flava]